MYQAYVDRQWKRRFGNERNRMKLLTYGAIGLFVVVLLGVIFFIGILAWFAKDLPRPDKVRRVTGLSTVIYDRNGETIYDIFESQNRIPVVFADIPIDLKHATVAIEDKEFYKHQGLSTAGIFRSIVNIFIYRSIQGGGSTLTQQLVKNVLLTNEQSFIRKIKEAILAIQIEQRYTKDEILQMYLNEAPYGGTAVGAEAAAKQYFNKHVKELTLVESVVLAGLPQSPSIYSPYGRDPKAYVNRSIAVARRMREDGYITVAQETDIKKQLDTVKFSGSGDESLRAPHFVAYVKELLIEKFGESMVDAGGLKVTTTLDLKLQESAQKIVKEEIDKIKYLKASNGSAVVIAPKTGEILAMIGSKDYSATDSTGYKFNVATQGLRQPGSTMKPISYAAALKKGYTASTLLLDVDTKYPSGDTKKPEYNPKNYDGKYRGPMQLRYALANSINTIAVKVAALVGTKEILRTAYDMGITSLEPTDANVSRIGLSLTLGGGEVKLLEITSAFGVFATLGERAEPISLLKVEDAKGKVLFEQKKQTMKRVMPADVCYVMSNILADNDARKDVFGTNSLLVISGKTVAVKTGTTDDKRDNWTIGYTPSFVVGVWVGNNDNSPMNPTLASGVTGAAPIWNRIMKEALKDAKEEPFVRPSSVIEMEIDAYAGGLSNGDAPKRKEIFVKGTEPTLISPIYQQTKISKRDGGKLASLVEIAKNEYDTKMFIVFTEQDPVSSDGKNRWQEGIDAWVATQTDSKYKPPKETYQGSGSDALTIVVKEPGEQTRINSNSVSMNAQAVGASDITRMEVHLYDGSNWSKYKEYNGNSVSDTITVSDGSYRIVKFKAIDAKGNSIEKEIHISINRDYVVPTPSPIPVVTETSAPKTTITITPETTP